MAGKKRSPAVLEARRARGNDLVAGSSKIDREFTSAASAPQARVALALIESGKFVGLAVFATEADARRHLLGGGE
jgi:hypothetical protein